MSEHKTTTYKYGITGFVELGKTIAKKYSEFDQLYWLKEHAVLMYLWPFKTDNILKYQSSCITDATDPLRKKTKKYYESSFKLYPATLADRKLYRDQEVIQFLLDMSSALTLLHSENITHRDIKPSNIAIDENGRYILIDFSHAHKMYTELVQLDKQVVTYWYRAPEVFQYQLNPETMYTDAIDIYALGMVLLEILTGVPFGHVYTSKLHDDIAETIYGNMILKPKEAFQTIKQYYSEKKRSFMLSNKYWDLIVKMLAHEPERRITAKELYEAVVNIARDNNIEYIEPINKAISDKVAHDNTEIEIKKEEPFNEILVIKCCEYLQSIRLKYRMVLDTYIVQPVIEYLVKQEFITQTNYMNTIAALAIVLETVIFDGVADIDTYGDLDNNSVKNLIGMIMSHYDQQLFSTNRLFKYESMIGSLEKLKISTNSST